jgi:hypothetical protein
MKHLSIAAGLGVFALAMHAHAADTIYRCGDSYSQQPCAGARTLSVDDPRTPAQAKQTQDAALRDAKAADAMEKARVAQEAKPAPVGMPPAKAESPRVEQPLLTKVKAKKGQKGKEPEHFTAVSPKKDGETKKPKKKKAG